MEQCTLEKPGTALDKESIDNPGTVLDCGAKPGTVLDSGEIAKY